MKPRSPDCEATRAALVARMADGPEGAAEHAEVGRHVAACSSCSRFRAGLEGVRLLFSAGPSYGPELRRRALAAAWARRVALDGPPLALLVPLALAGLLTSALPLAALTAALRPWLGSVAAAAAALSLASSFVLAAIAVSVTLVRRHGLTAAPEQKLVVGGQS